MPCSRGCRRRWPYHTMPSPGGRPPRWPNTRTAAVGSGCHTVPACEIIDDPAAPSRSLVEKLLTQHQVLGERTHSRSESVRIRTKNPSAYSGRTPRGWRGSVWVSFIAGRQWSGAFSGSLSPADSRLPYSREHGFEQLRIRRLGVRVPSGAPGQRGCGLSGPPLGVSMGLNSPQIAR